ncbi:hypothetical protein AALP_AAs48179U000400 [Arabis alpina]|uniref:LRAT domain-containing protein n=1 Tax=Arabis alpina TaxID=50452 RepID=A0A087G3J7_ARAAL|nr:hypothetical protein AALP_AAs48179U000400 [Arabis alpina]
MGLLSNKISRDDLKPGDHIYSWRNAYTYSHHGIYVGDGEVIHFTCGGGLEIRTGIFLDKMQEVIHFSRESGLEIGTGTFLDKMEELVHFSPGGGLETGNGTVLDKIEDVIHYTRGGVLETRMGIFLDMIEEVIQFTRGSDLEAGTETFLDKIEELIHFSRGGGLKTGRGTFLDKIEELIHFTRGGVVETRIGAFLDKFIVSSVPSHGGGNYPCLICGDQSNLHGVISSCLDCFLAGGNIYLFKYGVSKPFFMAIPRGGTCTVATSDPSDEVISRANFLFLRKVFGAYHLLENNCEDFAIYCKTGLVISSDTNCGSSGQANSVSAACGVLKRCTVAVLVPLTLGSVVSGGMVLISYGKYCQYRMGKDIGVRKDVCKIPVEYLGQILKIRLENKSSTSYSDTNNNNST